MNIFEVTTNLDSFPTDCWGNVDGSEELSATSHEDAMLVVQEWNDDFDTDGLDIMELDEQIGSDLLSDEIFGGQCGVAPVAPLEDSVYITCDLYNSNGCVGRPVSDDEDDSSSNSTSVVDEQYKDTLRKLSISMMKSQETRKSLSMKTPKTEDYSRLERVSGILSSSEESTKKLQEFLKGMRVVTSKSA